MTLYDADFVNWTKQQAAALRSMPSTNNLDIDHLVDEIDGLGRSAIADLSTAIRQLLSGLLLRSIDPDAISLEDIYSAQSEVIIRADAGVWRHVDIQRIWRLARRSMDVDVPDKCPLSIEQIIAEDFDIDQTLKLIRS
jgi:hypothetical protein